MANTSTGCSSLVDYLEKEEQSVKEFSEYLDKENRMGDKDYFFNHENDMIEKDEVTHGIDSNCYKLSRSEHRFFSITVNPSEKEIRHLSVLAQERIADIQKSRLAVSLTNCEDAQIKDEMIRSMMKDYTVSIMDEYAKNFNREGVKSSKNLVWYAKVERDRYYKPNSKEVIHNKRIEKEILRATRSGEHDKITSLEKEFIRESDIRKGGRNEVIKEWMPKSGDNYHVHIIVSRRDRERRYRLSPLSKARKNSEHIINGKKCMIGFNRNNFSNSIEERFDKITGYERSFSERYESRKLAKENPELYREKLLESLKSSISGYGINELSDRDNQLSLSGYGKSAGKQLAYRAGLEHIEKAARLYIQVGGIALKGAELLKGNESLKEKSRMVFEKMASEYVRLAGLGGLSVATYAMCMNLAVKGVSKALEQSKDGHSID